MSAPPSTFHRQSHLKIPLRFGVPRPEAEDLAKLCNGCIETTGITEDLSQTQMRFGEIRLYGKRAAVFGNGRLTRTGFLQQSPQVVPGLRKFRLQRHRPARVIE